MPWLPPGATLVIPSRGEIFYRYHRHADPSAPTVLFLHGWTASADLQFFTAYRDVARHFSFVAVDHHGHGRGLRSPAEFSLEACADDAAAVLRSLGLADVVVVGYSMGGPIGLHLTQRHPDLVTGIVVQATSQEWRATLVERISWRLLRAAGWLTRSRVSAVVTRMAVRRLLPEGNPLHPMVPWIDAEMSRNNAWTIGQAGQALGRYDARPFATSLGKPAAALITTKDHAVRPVKQRALAAALGAEITELADDHLAAWTSADAYSRATLAQIRAVSARTQRFAA